MPSFSEDRLAALKKEYALAAREPSNQRHGSRRLSANGCSRRGGQAPPAQRTRGFAGRGRTIGKLRGCTKNEATPTTKARRRVEIAAPRD
jgi:hypothetical protein